VLNNVKRIGREDDAPPASAHPIPVNH